MFIFNYEYANYSLLLNMGTAANNNSDVFLYPLTNLSLLPFNLIFLILINIYPLRHTYVVISMGHSLKSRNPHKTLHSCHNFRESILAENNLKATTT